ncbi:MAG: restriction endonuclease [Candidatus Krumholzibacteria bacterium]|nr:restriction endonuclease [Candidatus Krumholzibacteria bacterium]
MSIPDYQTVMLPLLEFAGDGREHSLREAIDHLAHKFRLTEQERKELLPSGTQQIFDNRVAWARTYLGKAGLLSSPRRGVFQITDPGREALAQDPKRIDVQFLNQYPEFREFREHKKKPKETQKAEDEATGTPKEILESQFQNLRSELESDILERLKDCPPSFFERLVVDLLVQMGYGGSRKDAGQAVGMSGDEGIDGIIKEDKLGLDIVYIQAKRWKPTVGRPDIQRFVGALQGKQAKKGVFITTSKFSKEAIDYAQKVENNIVLIDGEMLAQLMIDHNVGVATEAVYELKRIATDYFST